MYVEVVLVDYDNTLSDSDGAFARAFEGFLGWSGKKFWRIYLDELHRGVVHRFFPEKHDSVSFHARLVSNYFGVAYSPQLEESLYARFVEGERSCWQRPVFYEDVQEFFARIRAAGVRVGLATNSYSKEKARAVSKALGEEVFDYVFDENCLGARKTERVFYERALERVNASPEQVVMVGDSLIHDVLPAVEAGLWAIWVRRSFQKETIKHPRVRVVSGLRAAAEVIEALAGKS